MVSKQFIWSSHFGMIKKKSFNDFRVINDQAKEDRERNAFAILSSKCFTILNYKKINTCKDMQESATSKYLLEGLSWLKADFPLLTDGEELR